MTHFPGITPSPNFDELLARLDALLPMIEERAEAAEELGHLTDDVVGALRSGGLLNVLLPRDIGGSELLPAEVMLLIERMSNAHASVGWCASVNNMESATMALYLEDAGVEEVLKDGLDFTIAGNGVPRGFARPVDGGHMIKGDWAYGSSIYHAQWIHSGCFVTDQQGNVVNDEADHPKVIIAHHPRETIELLGNWNVLGLRATGSYNYKLAGMDELFVPRHMTFDFTETKPLRGGPQGQLGLTGYAAIFNSAWAAGVGRRLLDELAEHVLVRRDVFGKTTDSASFRFQYAQAEAKFRAARAFVYETGMRVSAANAAGRPHTLDDMTMLKLGHRHIFDALSDVATFVHRYARGASLHNTPMQRFYRDAHSASQHILMADQIIEECTRGMLGLVGENAYWTTFAIVE